MSALDFKATLENLIRLEMFGDGETRSGLINSVASGMVKNYEDYCRLTGKIRGLEDALKYVDEAWQNVYNPQPQEAEK